MANKTERALPPIPVKRYFSLEELCYLADIQPEQFFQWQQQKIGSQVKLHYFRHSVLHHTTAPVQPATANTAWLTIENPAALQAWLQI